MGKEWNFTIPGWVALVGLGIVGVTVVKLSNNRTHQKVVKDVLDAASKNPNIKNVTINGGTVVGE